MPAIPEQLLQEVCVLRAQAGDPAATEQLVAGYQPQLRYFLLRLLGPGGPVEDLLQDVWLAVFRQLPRLRAREAFSVWLYRIARNRAYDYLRRQSHCEPLTEDLVDPHDDDEAFTAEDAAGIHRCLEALAPQYREVLLLRFLEEMSYEEIAAVIGCAIGTMKSRLHHAKLQLRREMEKRDAQG